MLLATTISVAVIMVFVAVTCITNLIKSITADEGYGEYLVEERKFKSRKNKDYYDVH
jgi:hypothetical protein